MAQRKMEIDSLDIQELMELRDAVDARIESLAAQRLKALKNEMESLQAFVEKGAPGRKKSGKVAPKYRDPATGDTWAGRGRKPKWLMHRLDEGRKLEEFEI